MSRHQYVRGAFWADCRQRGSAPVWSARHIADVATQRHPRAAVPEQLRERAAEMGRVAVCVTAQVAGVLAARDWHAAARLDRDGDTMDRLQRSLYRFVLDGSWARGIEAAMDAALIGRFFERYADHAVAVAHRVAFLAGHEPLGWPLSQDRSPGLSCRR